MMRREREEEADDGGGDDRCSLCLSVVGWLAGWRTDRLMHLVGDARRLAVGVGQHVFSFLGCFVRLVGVVVVVSGGS